MCRPTRWFRVHLIVRPHDEGVRAATLRRGNPYKPRLPWGSDCRCLATSRGGPRGPRNIFSSFSAYFIPVFFRGLASPGRRKARRRWVLSSRSKPGRPPARSASVQTRPTQSASRSLLLTTPRSARCPAIVNRWLSEVFGPLPSATRRRGPLLEWADSPLLRQKARHQGGVSADTGYARQSGYNGIDHHVVYLLRSDDVVIVCIVPTSWT